MQDIECCLESSGEDITTLSLNITTTPAPVRDKREIEEFEIEDFTTTTKHKSKLNTASSIYTTDSTADYRETTTEFGTIYTTVSTFDTGTNYAETTTEFQKIEPTTTNTEASNVGYLIFLYILYFHQNLN